MNESWRHLTEEEIRTLTRLGNTADDWNEVTVCEDFDPALISRSHIGRKCRIALKTPGTREDGGLELPVGISDTRMCSCTVADGCAIHDVRFLSGYEIEENCLLFNIGSMSVSGDFGNPVLELMNENGSRKASAFPGMRSSDAFLMARYPDDKALQKRLREYSAALKPSARTGRGSTIANVQQIDRLQCGPACLIACAVQLERLSIASTEQEPVHISGNAVLKNGVIGAGSRVEGGCIAENFALGACCTLSGGARFFNSALGDNSTVSCAELVCNLIFPAHEQHHNNSFLIAACVGGQSNIAAGATIGSNHNSRCADGEIHAGRGFWPGLCVSLKHSSNFACYTLLAKGSYPAELRVPLPFSLVSNNAGKDRLELIPAFYWLYNMYSLARNSSKYLSRDRRKDRSQHIETDAFAPDSMQEVSDALRLLDGWAEKYCGWKPGEAFPSEITLDSEAGIEKSRRPVVILKADRARRAYLEMLIHYAASNLAAAGAELPDGAAPADRGRWINFGGQPLREQDADALRADVRSGLLGSWDKIHSRLDELWEHYPAMKRKHALSLLEEATGRTFGSREDFIRLIDEERSILAMMDERVRQSRAKDFADPFRAATFRNPEEMKAVVGEADDDPNILKTQQDNARLLAALMELRERLENQ